MINTMDDDGKRKYEGRLKGGTPLNYVTVHA